MKSEKTSAAKAKYRITLEVSEDFREALDSLKDKSDAASVAEVIRRAVNVYEIFLDHTKSNGEIVLRSSDGNKEKTILVV